MLALVTGANGFLGRYVVAEALASGARVRALVRPGADASVVDARAEVFRGDVRDAAAVRGAVAGCDVVYHLAGIRRSPDRDAFFSVNAGSTRLLLEACCEAGAARQRFVLAGSLASIGPSRDGKTEDDPFTPVEWYGESKAEAERIALSFAARVPVTIGRPPRIVGAGDRENLFFFRIVAGGVVLRIVGPERPLSWIDVGDCARAFTLLASHPAAAGEPFFLASRERTSVEGLQRVVARVLAIQPRVVPVPPALLTAAAWAADAVSVVTRTRLPLNRKLAKQLLAPGWTCRTDKAERLLGFAATTSLADSVAQAARWYREQGWL